MSLDFLFVLVNLVLNAMNGTVHRLHQIGVCLFGHKVMFMLGIHLNFYFRVGFCMKINNHGDHRDAVEKMEKFSSLFFDDILDFFMKVSMSGSDLNLHGQNLSFYLMVRFPKDS